MVGTILTVDIVNDFLPPLVAEIHIEIGHTDALRVQETLKDQVVTDGIDIRNADAVCGNTARAGTTARAYRDALALGVVDVIPDDEVVIGIAHRFDDANFIAQAVLVGLRDIGAIAALQALPAELFKKILVVHSTRGLIIRNLGVAKIKLKIALISDDLRIRAGFRYHGKQIVHFVCRFDVEFIGLELHAVRILHGLARLDAEQNGLYLGVFLAQIVGIVGCHHGNPRLPGQLDELGQYDVVLFQPVVL